MNEALSTKDAKKLNKASALYQSSDPKDQDRARARRTEIDYKDVKLLRRFINDQGKIMPRRVTGTSAKMHRKVVRAIRRARSIALMPYTESGLE